MTNTHSPQNPVLAALALATLLTLASCGGGGGWSPPPAPTRPDPRPSEDRNEHLLRLNAEERLQQLQSTTGLWQTLAMCLSAASVAMLMVGAALGSRARHESQNENPQEHEQH